MELLVTELFNKGRTCYNFSSKEVTKELLEEIYDLMKLGPTSANGSPLRIKFVTSIEAKEKLLTCVMEGNLATVKAAPVTAIFAYDIKFYERMDMLFPQNPGLAEWFENDSSIAEVTAFRNANLQAAYFMIVARSRGLGIGPMSGYDSEKLDNAFFAGTSLKSDFICNLGYPAGDAKYPRLPRLSFDEVCEIV